MKTNFLVHHGFQRVLGRDGDDSSPADPELFSQAIAWIHDYLNRSFVSYFGRRILIIHLFRAGRRINHNRYLNAVRSTDEVIGPLARALDKMKLRDDTLLVITGNHGDAFGEHKQTTHNWTVFDEEFASAPSVCQL